MAAKTEDPHDMGIRFPEDFPFSTSAEHVTEQMWRTSFTMPGACRH